MPIGLNKVFFPMALAAGLVIAPMADAEGLRIGGSKKNRSQVLKSQIALLDGRLSKQYKDSVRLTPNYDAKKPDAGATSMSIPGYRGKYKGEYLVMAREAAQRHGVPEDLFLRLVQQESGWNAGAVSHKGATGLAQLMPGTAAKMGVDPTVPSENLDGGARYLRMMYDRFGSWRLALAAYNAGPGAVEEHGGIPPYAETKNYVIKILG
jgi:soluble lytic murein transglycosylase-like protein